MHFKCFVSQVILVFPRLSAMMMTSELPKSPFLTLHKIKYPRLGENIYSKNDLTSILLRAKKEREWMPSLKLC